MATPAQVLANRENAQLSTGPRTQEGKAKAAQNAVRHNLTARGLIVPLGMEDDFASVEAALLEHLQPLGDLQDLLFKRILECAWNVERCRRAEAQLFAQSEDHGLDPLLDRNEDPRYLRIQKYARQNDNSMLKMMRELGRLQTEFQFRDEIHELTGEERNDPEKFEATPQARSVVCSTQKVVAAWQQTELRKFQIGANRDRASLQMLEQLTAPPLRRAAA